MGADTDRDYLAALTSGSGGSLIEAATPAELRQAYTSLAFAIRSQYTLVTEVPRSIDRTVPGTLKVHVIHRADNAFAERELGPLAGAFPPPFTMALGGIKPGDKHNGTVELVPTVEEGIEVAKIDYFLDDKVVHTTEGVGNYTLDASQAEERRPRPQGRRDRHPGPRRAKCRSPSSCRSWSLRHTARACRSSRF